VKSKFFLLLTLLVLVALAAPAYAGPDASQLYLDGVSFYQAGKYADAEARFKAALTNDPKHVSSAFMMGETLARDVRRLREAEGWYQKVIREAKNDKVYGAKTRYSLGMLYIQMGLYEQAIAQFQELATSSPGYFNMPKVYNYIGVARYHLDQYDEALDSFKHALRLDNNLMEATFNMKTLQVQLSLINTARYYERMGDDTAAKAQYDKAIEAYPAYVSAWFHLGLLHLKLKDYENAVKCITRAKALNPMYRGGKEIPYQLAAAYLGRRGEGDLDEALKIYEKDISYRDSMLKAGMVLVVQGKPDAAEKYFSKTADSTSLDKMTRAEGWYQLGSLYNGKDKAKAQGCFKKALELMPGEERYKAAAGPK
jgi:tetratricopeptide (TPR) repeat protein